MINMPHFKTSLPHYMWRFKDTIYFTSLAHCPAGTFTLVCNGVYAWSWFLAVLPSFCVFLCAQVTTQGHAGNDMVVSHTPQTHHQQPAIPRFVCASRYSIYTQLYLSTQYQQMITPCKSTIYMNVIKNNFKNYRNCYHFHVFQIASVFPLILARRKILFLNPKSPPSTVIWLSRLPRILCSGECWWV